MSLGIKEELFGITTEVLDKTCQDTGLDVEDIIELQEDFFNEFPNKYQEALELEQAGDKSSFERLGHSIKGSAGQVGLPAIRDLGRQMEEVASINREKWFELAQQLLQLANAWKNNKQ